MLIGLSGDGFAQLVRIMRGILQHAEAVFCRFVSLGFGVQMILGLLWMYKAFDKGIGSGFVCVGKLVFFVWAMYFFLEKLWNGKRKAALLGSLAITTFPMVLQCHLAEGVYSYITSCLLVGTGCACRMIRARRRMYQAAGWILALGVAGAGIWSGMVANNDSRDFMTDITERFVWSSLHNSYRSLPEEYQDLVDYGDMIDSTYEAVGIKNIFIPSLSETAGESKNLVLRELIRVAWIHRKKQIVKEIVWDGLGYAVPPLVVPLQLSGRAYDSYTGANYRQLLRVDSTLGRIYMSYGCAWFAVSLAGTVLLWIAGRNRRTGAEVGMLWTVGFLMVACCTMSGAGQMDYKATCYVLCMWLTWIETVAMACFQQSEEKKIAGEAR